jgi:hypothetical protein
VKLKRPNDTLFNIRGFLPVPIFLFMIVIVVDITTLYLDGQAEGWKVGAAYALLVYLAARSYFGLRQTVDFSRD